ncbi:MAG: PepSY domain-containing protein [Flavobacteriaceae bacterium]|nr:PepSY domain-containing protein [Flavobacteriaceae bacterium]
MLDRKKKVAVRKAHRYLGLFLGVQFLLWTLSGLYFSWTDIDEIHGDDYKQLPPQKNSYSNLIAVTAISNIKKVETLELLEIDAQPYYWVNESQLVHAQTGETKTGISSEEALAIANRYMRSDLVVVSIKRIDSVGPHHEYRGRPLPAFEISYETAKNVKAYVAIDNGAFQTVRFRDWRWFDFLWMTHTMDYQGRDDINTLLLRIFSIGGLLTVLSGLTLWGTSSPRLRKLWASGKRKTP